MEDWLPLPFDREPRRTPPPVRKPISVSELTGRLKALIEDRFSAVLVEGEISNCKQWSSGHIYFTLKDDHAQMRAVLFRTQARQTKFKVEDGLRVVVRGRISVYDVKGEYQLVCDSLEPQGLGALQLAFEQLKKRLHAEGLFDAARKRPLPVLPRRIGVITSLDGAAVRDILRILVSRHPSVRVVIRTARVQGDGAALDLVRAMRALVRAPDIDVIIIGRGGGSVEDLWAFNEESLARAIVNCPVPVISAVGHEVDFTIADFVADVRAATPSNAAELVVDRADNFRTRIDRAEHRLYSVAALSISRRRQREDRATALLRRWMTDRLARTRTRFESTRRRLERRDVRSVVGDLRTRLTRAEGRLSVAARTRRTRAESRARELAARLDAMSPLAVLGRGYAVCWNEDRTSIIRSARSVVRGQGVNVTLADGELECRVENANESIDKGL